ncbi:glycosyltransferase family 2 protein [Synechococcus sp. CBW1002]|uniref:glycosyltransferase family 2 protein n=1 Tax=Synechococcus sp. CBW1002 TaxID=1353134 RepID=UPI0018CE17AE|nr:glycosyltransferase family A protein [Synechococcus sp. CBW1002]QPN60262.1 glycosyltransferase family 2 protein [Synechococcus sp. CBW1002]
MEKQYKRQNLQLVVPPQRPRLDIVIPSRSQPDQAAFLKESIASIERQSLLGSIHARAIICCDPDYDPSNIPQSSCLAIEVVESEQPLQAAALNAGLVAVDAHFVAFLEDDDAWHPRFLETALAAHQKLLDSGTTSSLISSNQLEVDSNGVIERVNDFATPSGWFMSIATLRNVGLFDPRYRLHLDNDWLGRAAAHKVPRIHLVEALAPMKVNHLSQVRPWLFKVLKNSNGTCRLARHSLLIPLVRRLVHPDSGMARISRDPQLAQESAAECQRLVQTYGRIPW